ncbi:voltage-dependent calcium channel beta subunit-associated regulatory protein isoform X2 [Pseudoliparis swirei]|uniref:voltage-dependent calcium channel beta subunit-associated regulatory protein isoform X2 n=1 Tax=Pseudoliparis swirei TaxID=2059687 RepID=UPI0024BE7A99|nr:voltage-dependent calcium channel beta subunit-associated regulatory protein isoform X2 [Pseudoliparis swirei]
MSNDSPVLTSLTENSTDVPVAAGEVENYVLLLVLLSVFAGGTLVLLSLLLLFCHRCCLGGRRYSRASDDPEKTNTTQEITIYLDESDALSAASCHDGASERFVSTGSTGRRVSFTESALYEAEKTTPEKGRRYTLTEGDFHHLKKARLTHLHLPPAPCDLKILTIMECDSTESSSVNINETAAPKLPLTIYKPTERRVPDWMGLSLSGGLPGDPHHSTILDQSPRQASSAMTAPQSWSQTMEALGDRGEAESQSGMRGESIQAPGQTSVLRFFSKLRRHASLEGAGPYFRKWKFDSSHRAASLDAKGSPKRRPFQRQRAASETTNHSDDDSLSLRDEVTESFPRSPDQTSGLQSLSAESLSQPDAALASSIFLSRLNLEAMVESGGSSSARGEELCSPSIDHHARRPDEATANGTRVEQETKCSAGTRAEAVGGRRAVEDDDLFEVQQGTAVEDGFEDMLRTTEDTQASDTRNRSDADEGDELVLGAEARLRADSGSSLSFMARSEAPPCLYRDIWSLRASLEQYASSDQSSTDRESIRSDGDSASSHGGAGARSGLDSCFSQDLDDEEEGEAEMLGGGVRGASGGGSGAGGEGESGNRKLLQMDSGYTSIEAPSRAPEEMRLFGTPGAPRGKSASERRLFFTSSGRKGSVCESVEAKLFQEELEDEMADVTRARSQTGCQSLTLQEPHELLDFPQTQESQSQLMSPLIKPIPQPSTPHKTRLRRRDYSIDEKTDALFNEFLRHDPLFDQQESPLRSRHRSRVHLRKQWQRHKQYSDPGSGAGGRYSPSLERQRFTPLRRGDSAGYPLDTRYHSTLSRIASAADEEASEGAACEEEASNESTDDNDPPREGGEREALGSTADATKSWAESSEEGDGCRVARKEGAESTTIQSLTSTQTSNTDPRGNNRNNNSRHAVPSESSLADKLAVSVEERLYGSLRRAERLGQGGAERTLTAAHAASPGFGPV